MTKHAMVSDSGGQPVRRVTAVLDTDTGHVLTFGFGGCDAGRHHWSKTSFLADIACVIVQVSAPYKKRTGNIQSKGEVGGHDILDRYIAIPLCHAVPRNCYQSE